MRASLVAAVGGLLVAASAVGAQTLAKPPARPGYNMQKPSEDIGPFAGGAKVRRTMGESPAAVGKSHRAHRHH